MNIRRWTKWGLGFTLLLTILFMVAHTSGFYAYAQNQYTKFRIFNEIYKDIRTHYVDEKDPNELIDKAIEGMLDMLDPHTQYMNAKSSGRMDDTFQGYEGIGISFLIIDETITIMDVMDEGPSRRLGLGRGDRIVKINGEDAIGLKAEDVPRLLKGPRGTKVTVHVERPNWDEPREFTIIRDKTYQSSVPYVYMISETVGYVGVDRFTATTEREFENALRKLEAEGMSQLLFDLRYNTGGYLQAAVGVADRFLPGNRKIVYTRGRTKRSAMQYNSTDNNTHPFYPIIIMLNEQSASASEIVSGALQDWDRALVVGKTSFGKGLVQTPFKFQDGSQLLLTTARYYTPSGRLIQRPYEDKSREEYYQASHTGDNQDITDYPDSLIFHTNAGRAVFGGGGITPDFLIDREQLDSTLTAVWAKIPDARQRYAYLNIGDQFSEDHAEYKDRREWFIESFEVSDELYTTWVRDRQERTPEDTPVDQRITMEEMQTHREYFANELKAEIAHQYWGGSGARQIRLKYDVQALQALTYYDDATALLQNYANYISQN